MLLKLTCDKYLPVTNTQSRYSNSAVTLLEHSVRRMLTVQLQSSDHLESSVTNKSPRREFS